MAEPASSSVLGLLAAGAGASILAALGLDPVQLFWALIGSTIGVTFAAATSRMRAAIVFVCVVLLCSLAGAAIAVSLGGGPAWSKLGAALLAVAFHPLINAAIVQIPAVVTFLRRKFIGGDQ